MKVVNVTHKCDKIFQDLPLGPSVAFPDMDIPLSTLLSRFINGQSLPSGVVHNAQYSEQLSPLTAKGVDLCDYSSIKAQTQMDIQTLTDEAILQDRLKKESNTKVTEPARDTPVSD